MTSKYEPHKNEFGETRGYRLKEMRTQENASIRWVSKRTGIPRAKLEQLENDEAPFDSKTLIKLNNLFGTKEWVNGV